MNRKAGNEAKKKAITAWDKVPPEIVGASVQFSVKHFYALIACILVTFLCYIPSIANGWTHWDDNVYVYENPLTRHLSFSNLRHFFTSFQTGNYHPFAMLSLGLDFRLFGMNAAAFHFHNILLHIGSTGLVFLVVRMLSGRLWVCTLTALFFGVHPAHVESVSWISERKDLLYTFYYLAGMIAYMKYIQPGSRKRWYILTLFLFLLSLLAKGQAVSFPLALLLIDYFRDGVIDKETWRKKIPFFILSLVFGIIAVFAQHNAKAIMDIAHYSFPHRILFASYALLSYFVKAFLPLNLSAYYAYPVMTQGHYSWLFYVSPFAVLILLAAVIYSMKKNRFIAFGFGFFLINVVLVLQVLPIGGVMMAERYTYLSYIGLFFMMFTWVDHLLVNTSSGISMLKYPVVAMTLALTAFFCIKTYARQSIWKSDLSLFSDMLANCPDAVVVNNNMGNTLQEMGKTEEAIIYFSKAARLQPDFADAYTNRGSSYLKMGNADAAITDLTLAMQYHPRDLKNYLFRAQAFKMKEEPERALKDLNKALTFNNPDPSAMSVLYFNLGDAYDDLKQYPISDSCYELSLDLDPSNVLALNNYAYNLAARNERLEKAEAMAYEALQLDNTNYNTMDTYGWILYKKKKYTEAKKWLDKALGDDEMQNNGEALEHYGDVLFRTGDTTGALQYWQKAKDNHVKSETVDDKIAHKGIK